jgi:hypothetical protein
MKIFSIILIHFIAMLLASCATVKTYEGETLPRDQLAVIKSSYWNHLIDTIVVIEVDGKSVGFSPGDIIILPGEHKVKVRVNSGAGIVSYSGTITMVLYAEAGHAYKVDGKISGGEYLWAWILDEDTSKIVAGRKPGSGDSITKNNNQIDMPHYSIEVPPDQGWNLNVINKEDSTLELTKLTGSTASSLMRFSINWVASESMKSWTAKQVADNYRNGELSDMQSEGRMAGILKLEDVLMGEEIVGGKKFFTMDYVAIGSDMKQSSSLYLYFPKEIDIGVFIVAIYVDGFTDKEMMSKSSKPDFIRVLESLQVVEDK